MSKDIWHTKNKTPRQESRVLWESGNVVCGGRFDTYYKCFCGPASQFVDLKRVSRWAYLDDLLALETKLERTRKALKIAVDALESAKTRFELINNSKFANLNNVLQIQSQCEVLKINKALEQITALEQKEEK